MPGAGSGKDSCRWSDLWVLTMRQYHLNAFQRNDLTRWARAASMSRDVTGGLPPTTDSSGGDDQKVRMPGQRAAGGDGFAVFTNPSSLDNHRPIRLTYSGLLYFPTRGRRRMLPAPVRIQY